MTKARKKRPPTPVVAIPGAERAEDALKRLHEALTNENPKGVIVITVAQDGTTDTRLYGQFVRQEIAWAGAELTNEAFQK